ncbi:MAG: hypothetical protein ACE15B_04030 [Bryobacteraceae bacterium]
MKDWKAVAAGLGREIPPTELERIASSLDSLEATFRLLAAAIPEDVEPALVFRAAEEEA